MCESAHPHSHDRPHEPDPREFRVVLTGKGGVGKTSITALLARLLARDSYRVLALDADPQMNLPHALGLTPEQARLLVPLSQNADYIEEKTGVRPGSGYGLFLRLNPDVRDVVDRFGARGPDGVRVMVMGTVVQPAAGCLCPENSLLASVVGAMSLREREAILMDTQAGVEHFGRALAKGFRHAAIVTDATFNSVQVALHAARLSRELGIPNIHLVVNRVRHASELVKVIRILSDEGGFDFTSRHALPYDDEMFACEPEVGSLLGNRQTPLIHALQELRDALIDGERELRSCAS